MPEIVNNSNLYMLIYQQLSYLTGFVNPEKNSKRLNAFRNRLSKVRKFPLKKQIFLGFQKK